MTGAIVLAGGRSSRMNYPKCYLEVHGVTLLENLYNAYKDSVKVFVVVLNSEFAEHEWERLYRNLSAKFHFILNEHPDFGRLFSLQLGMSQMNSMNHCFIQNIDNPVSPQIISQLLSAKASGDYAVPAYHGTTGHPIIVSRRIMDELMRNQSCACTLRDVLRKYKRTEVSVDSPLVNFNLNSPLDFAEYIQATRS